MMLELRNICKTYTQGKLDVPVLKDVSLSVARGEYVAVMGPSGSGKTTLMNLIGCLDVPTSGEYLLEGEDLSGLNDKKLSQVRLKSIGFVFQSFYLLPRETALENVALPLLYAGVRRRERLEIAGKALERVGLGDRAGFKHPQLSGGQCQRVAIARAIVNNPKLLLADEPTGALDTQSGEQIMEIFQRLSGDGVTIVMITHEREIAAHAGRVLRIRDGRLLDENGAFQAPVAEKPPVPADAPLAEDLRRGPEFGSEPEFAPEAAGRSPLQAAEDEPTPAPAPRIVFPIEVSRPFDALREDEAAPAAEEPTSEEAVEETLAGEDVPVRETGPEEAAQGSGEEIDIENIAVDDDFPDDEIAALLDAGEEPSFAEGDAFLREAGVETEEEQPPAEETPGGDESLLVAKPTKAGAPEQISFDIWREPEETPFDTAFDAVDPYEPQEYDGSQGRFGAPKKTEVDLSTLFRKEDDQ